MHVQKPSRWCLSMYSYLCQSDNARSAGVTSFCPHQFMLPGWMQNCRSTDGSASMTSIPRKQSKTIQLITQNKTHTNTIKTNSAQPNSQTKETNTFSEASKEARTQWKKCTVKIRKHMALALDMSLHPFTTHVNTCHHVSQAGLPAFPCVSEPMPVAVSTLRSKCPNANNMALREASNHRTTQFKTTSINPPCCPPSLLFPLSKLCF